MPEGISGGAKVQEILAWAQSVHVYDKNDDLIGYLASALVFATFSMRSMRLLRMTAILSNVAFIMYAALADIRPVLVLHGILLPVNVVRLLEIWSARNGNPLRRAFAISSWSGRPRRAP